MDLDHCWICLQGSQEAPSNEWRKICACNLRAHETCLLQWAQQSDDPKCPQCSAPVRVESQKSLLVSLRDGAEKVVRVVGSNMIIWTVSHGSLGLIYAALYELGANTIQLMCSESQALSLLGTLKYNPFSMENYPFPFTPLALFKTRSYFQWWGSNFSPLERFQIIRRSMLVPLIPVLTMVPAGIPGVEQLIALLPVAMWAGKWRLDGLQRSFMMLLLARRLYINTYARTVTPLLKQLADTVEENTRREAAERALAEQGLGAQPDEEVEEDDDDEDDFIADDLINFEDDDNEDDDEDDDEDSVRRRLIFIYLQYIFTDEDGTFNSRNMRERLQTLRDEAHGQAVVMGENFYLELEADPEQDLATTAAYVGFLSRIDRDSRPTLYDNANFEMENVFQDMPELSADETQAIVDIMSDIFSVEYQEGDGTFQAREQWLDGEAGSHAEDDEVAFRSSISRRLIFIYLQYIFTDDDGTFNSHTMEYRFQTLALQAHNEAVTGEDDLYLQWERDATQRIIDREYAEDYDLENAYLRVENLVELDIRMRRRFYVLRDFQLANALQDMPQLQPDETRAIKNLMAEKLMVEYQDSDADFAARWLEGRDEDDVPNEEEDGNEANWFQDMAANVDARHNRESRLAFIYLRYIYKNDDGTFNSNDMRGRMQRLLQQAMERDAIVGTRMFLEIEWFPERNPFTNFDRCRFVVETDREQRPHVYENFDLDDTTQDIGRLQPTEADAIIEMMGAFFSMGYDVNENDEFDARWMQQDPQQIEQQREQRRQREAEEGRQQQQREQDAEQREAALAAEANRIEAADAAAEAEIEAAELAAEVQIELAQLGPQFGQIDAQQILNMAQRIANGAAFLDQAPVQVQAQAQAPEPAEPANVPQNLISASSVTARMVYATLAPYAVSFVGRLLSALPIFRDMDTFNRNLIALGIITLVRDTVNVATAFARAKQATKRRVLQWNEQVDSPNTWWSFLFDLPRYIPENVRFELNMG